jgi:hypothetical protein
MNLVFNGQSAKGLQLMQQGIAKGGLKRPEDAKLHLAIAYLLAGDNVQGAGRVQDGVRQRRYCGPGPFVDALRAPQGLIRSRCAATADTSHSRLTR